MEKIFLLQHISKISILRNHVVFFMCLVCALKVSAMTDVTKRYLENDDFSEGPVVSVPIITYENYVTGDAVFGLQNVLGWKKSIVADDPESPGNGMAGGVVAYGSSNLPAPATGYDGKDTGNCLCFWAVWGCGSYYYQDVTLPAGRYTLTIPVYNASGTKAYESYIGFLSEEGTSYVISGTPSVGKWTTLTTTFLLTEETKGNIALGYKSSGEGSSVAPQLYFDYVKIEYEEWVDYTSHIQNPGFDEDISFNNDGSAAKEYVYSYDWGDEIEGWLGAMHYSADGSIYNEDKCGKQGTNAAGLPNWDGFKATIRGWETTNKNDSAIWIYYGCIPYNLGKGMMQLGGGVDGTGDVTEKPSAIATEDNTGVLYLKAGWQNACTYKQTVRKLPTAKYRLTYFIRNTNVDKSRLYAEATNLCNVTCNGVSFVDNEGFNSKGWIKHSIEFVPVDSFSVEFGCRASNDYSYNNPILWVDGIELHKIGVAEEDDIDNAYSELVVKVDSLAGVMHFAADKAALQSAITTFNTDKDYVALYQAILKAEASERKYHEIISIESVFQIIADSLDIVTEVPYGVAKDIVQYAFDKTSTWMASSTATYLDADTWITQLNAYANVYAPMYIEAEQFVNNEEGIRAEKVRNLMASQRTALIESDLKTPLIVDQYIKALRQAMGMQEQELNCSSLPVLTYGDAAYTLPANTKEELTLVWTCSNNEVATINGNLLTINGAGTTTVTATQAGNDNYLPFTREFTLTVSKAALTITADDKEKQQGEDNPALTVSYAGFKYNDNASSLTKQPTVTTTATVNSPAGTYPITASGAEADNYTISYVQGTLTVTAAPVNTTVLAPSDITGREDEEVELPITLDNAEYGENVVGVSFTLQLPEDVSLVLDADDDPVWSFVSERVNKKQFNVTPAQYADGTWGFRIYTTSASGIIKGTSGAFMTLTLKVAAGMEDGEYTIKLKDNKLSVKDATNNVSSVTLADATSTLTIENYVLGDVNADGEIDLSDAIMVTYYSLHIVPSGFILKAADMNADGEVDLSDAIIIIYKSLGVIDSRSMQPANEIWYANDYLQMDADANGFSISLTNEGQYLGMQYDLVLPEGMTLEDVTLNKSRAAGHTVMWNRLEDGSYRVVAFSTNGTPFFGNTGELLNLRLSGNHAGQVRMENIFFVGIDLQKHLFEDLYLQTTGICEREKGIVKSGEAVYDLQGRKVTTPRKGLYLKGNNMYLVK